VEGTTRRNNPLEHSKIYLLRRRIKAILRKRRIDKSITARYSKIATKVYPGYRGEQD
jgi:hypothetical protein